MQKGVSLDAFANGGLLAQFNRELEKVAANICDPNTSATAKRTITMTVSIKPDEERELGNAEVSAKSTLCPVKSVSTKILFGFDTASNEGLASELSSQMLGQISLDERENPADETQDVEIPRKANVIDLRKAGGK